MVFTIVTIIFLPLSFITSIFTINLTEFPKGPDGVGELHLSYVAKYTFGIGFAISIPLILLALSVDDIGDVCQEAMRHMRRWLSRRRKSTDDQLDEATLEMEKIISTSKSRRSMDTRYAGSLLPVSTRGSRPA